jgi:signal transduction histidine kinase
MLPPSRRQERLAAAIALLLLVAMFITLPFRNIHLLAIDSFIPAVDTALFLIDAITAALLFAQFAVLRSRAPLVLACGYLFTGLIIIPHGLTFPGAFSPTGLLGAGLQSTTYLYIFWHLGIPPCVIAYALLKRADPSIRVFRGNVRTAIAASCIGVLLFVCLLTLLVTAGESLLPSIMINTVQANVLWHFTAPFLLTLSTIAIVLLWKRRESVLDLWLLVVLWAWFIETILLTATDSRFTLVWYAGRAYGLISSSFVLIVLLSEATKLYARQVINAVESRVDVLQELERRRIASELHDSTAQHIIAADLGLMHLKTYMRDAPEGASLLEQIHSSIDQAQKELRVFTYLMYPADIEKEGLKAVVERLVKGFASRTELVPTTEIGLEVDFLPYALQSSALRIVQEALSNVRRHAQASKVTVRIGCQRRRLVVHVRDNGRGMRSDGKSRAEPGVGIPGMQARVRGLGGELRIVSGSHGTSVVAEIPLPDGEPSSLPLAVDGSPIAEMMEETRRTRTATR